MPYKTGYRKKYTGKKKIFGKMNASKIIVKKKRNNLVSLIKQINLKQAEVKYKTLNSLVVSLNHDVLEYFHLWDSAGTASVFPTQGTTDSTRIGDRIMAQGMRIRMALSVPYDRRNVSVKMWYVPYNSGQGSPTTYADFYHNISGNSQLDPIQTKRWPGIKFLGNFFLKSRDRDVGTTHTDATILINKWIPLKKAIHFQADYNNVPINMRESGRIIIAPYDTTGSAVTDIVVTRLEATTTLYYKDL